ncbi:oligosaccharide flippase family protein [Paenibacillus wynnii]|uniref:oligosaccharide flippase family protein n=1 Tax=Paenibacillus wynnii TaxID=268407 RepID=UPI00279375D3|nr:oligosaccharide flippase family protein [Paenibacillus wynnii]MDQ0196273.1 O-antigen/teichoic acid export membrane protein [Paenibacillus wynnii]
MSNVKKNYLYSVCYQMLNIILPIITAPYLSRIIGVENLGIYSYTQSIANYFVLLAMLGLNNYGNRSIAAIREDRDKTSKTFWSIYCIQFTSSIIIIIVYMVYLGFFAANVTLALIWSLFILAALFDINWLYFGLEQFKLTVTRNIVIKLISVVLIFVMIKTKEDLWIYTLIISLSMLVNQLVLWLFIKKYIDISKVTFHDIKKHIKPLLVLFIPVIAVSIYTILDKIMIGALSTMEENGFFENAQKIMIVPTGLITALGVVMLPKISNLVTKGDFTKIKGYISMSMLFTSMSSLPIAFGIAGIAPIFAPVFFGTDFIPSGVLMTLLSITVVFIAWANVIRTQYLIPNYKDKVYVVSVIIGAIINIIINALLIPDYGARGAAIGTVIAEFSVALYQTWAVRNQLDIADYIKNSVPYLIISVFMFITVRFIGKLMEPTIYTLILQLLIGIAIYLLLSFLYIKKSKNPSAKLILNRVLKLN